MKYAILMVIIALSTECLATPPAQSPPEDTEAQLAPADAAWSVSRCTPPSDEEDPLPIVPSALFELEQECPSPGPPIPDRINRYGPKTTTVNAQAAPNDAVTSQIVNRSITARTRTSGRAAFNAGEIRAWRPRVRFESAQSKSSAEPVDALGRSNGVDPGEWTGEMPLNRPGPTDDSTL